MYFDYHEPLAKSRENNNKTSSLDDQEEGTEDAEHDELPIQPIRDQRQLFCDLIGRQGDVLRLSLVFW